MGSHVPYFEDARIVNVIAKHIKSGRSLIVVGPRDVGKTLYVQLAVWRASAELNRQILDICNENPQHHQTEGRSKAAETWIPHPVLLGCPGVGRTRLGNLVCCGRRIRQKPVYLIDNAHLCKDVEVTELDGVVILIYPSPSKPRRRRFVEVQILPFRFIETVEVLRRDIRSKLTELKHYKAENRLNNLQNLQKLNEIINKLDEVKDQLDEVLKYYLFYGGTAWGIELTARCLSNEEPPHVAGSAVGGHLSDKRESELCQEPPVAFFDTINEILEDAREYGVRPEVVKAVLYSAAERVFEKGLEVGDIYEEVRNLAQEIANVKVETNDIRTAIDYLRKSHVLFTIKKEKLSKSQKEEGGGDSKSDSHFKIVFSDPRYALGAYMHYQHTLHGTTYVDAYYKVKDEIMGQLDKIAHYLESIFLANVALGVYALVTSLDRPDRGHLPDKFVKYLKNGWEIDAYVTIKRRDGPISFLAEFSINYDGSHVEKCSEAADHLNTYCIYAVYKESEVRLEDNVLTTPLSLFLALL